MSSRISSADLRELLSARTTVHTEAIMAKLPIVPPDEYQWDYGDKRVGKWKPGHFHWLPVGLDRGNGGRIKLAGEPMNPIAERTVNGMEALIELARLSELLQNPRSVMPTNPRDAVLRYFGLPRLDAIERMDDEERKAMHERVHKVRNRLTIHLDHEGKSKQFAVTIRDRGMGQTPTRMHHTLLSLGQSDKADKPYLIGVFGQGGSSAFSVSEYSIVVSRRAPGILTPGDDAGVGWSIVRAIQPTGRRDLYYAYLAASEQGAVPSVDKESADKVGFAHGTHFCHIKYDFGGSASAVTRLLYQALNHVLFNPILPYDLYALKDKPELMQGTAQRLARQVRMVLRDRQPAIDKSFVAQPVA
jgi:hypothetical protein